MPKADLCLMLDQAMVLPAPDTRRAQRGTTRSDAALLRDLITIANARAEEPR